MKRQWTQDELVEHWTLMPDELKLLANKTGATRLSFGLLLKASANQGRFPRHMHELPRQPQIARGLFSAGYRRRATGVRRGHAEVPGLAVVGATLHLVAGNLNSRTCRKRRHNGMKCCCTVAADGASTSWSGFHLVSRAR